MTSPNSPAQQPVEAKSGMEGDATPSDDFPRPIQVRTSITVSEAGERLRAMVRDHPAIEGKRHWLSERCVTGHVNGTDVRADVRYRYASRWYAWNSWTIGLSGSLIDERGSATLQGELQYLLREATGGLRVVWLMAVATIILAIVIALEGIASGRPSDLFALLGVPLGILILVAIPRVETFLDDRARTDAAMLERYLRHILT